MKYLLLLLSVLFIFSCKEKVNYCSEPLTGKDGFMLHGGILDAYDNGRVFISIVKVNNPKNWDYNEYFTGDGFSPIEEDEKRVLQADSCELKQLYFEYLKTQK